MPTAKELEQIEKLLFSYDDNISVEFISKDNNHGYTCNGNIIHEMEFRKNILQSILSNPSSYKQQLTNIQEKNWLCKSLLEEIDQYTPARDDVDRINGKRNEDEFAKQCATMFPTGRVFASKRQLSQTLQKFLQHWCGSFTDTGASFKCSFAKSTKKKTSLEDVTKETIRKRESQKEKVQCPFVIRFNFINKPKKKEDGLDQEFYLVKITSCHYNHNHEISPVYLRTVLKSSGKLVDINSQKLCFLLEMIFHEPNKSTKEIRPHLQNILPEFVGIDSQFISNFLQRAKKYLVENGPPSYLDKKTMSKLTSSKKLTAEDYFLNTDDPAMRANFTKILRKIMKTDKGTWTALKFLRYLKKTIRGFDFRVSYDDNGIPNGIIWMTHEMRLSIIRYGDIICFDMQGRQMNSSHWPYGAACLMDGEKRLRLGVEFILIEECIEYYVWVIIQISKMEPRFNINNIKIIFADQKITIRLLVMLGIEETCVLHGDYYHLTRKVWPAAFGVQAYQQIKTYLSAMLRSRTKEARECRAHQGWNKARPLPQREII